MLEKNSQSDALRVRPTVAEEQRLLCERYGADPMAPDPDEKVGIALSSAGGRPHVWNGIRHLPAGGTCGWYLWPGEVLSKDDDFFSPLCARHLPKYCPQILKYLALPPGWRFLFAPGYEDVWFDEDMVIE